MKKKTNPASSLLYFVFTSMAVFLIISSTTMVATAGFEFKVGNQMGWRVPPANNSGFYNHWASINRFQVGDSLSFVYTNDSVLMVEKWDYYHCNSSEPIMGFNNGKGVINLDRSGPFYFISGFPDHCKNGQRLVVEVISPHDHNLPFHPPIIAAPPEDYYRYDGAPAPSRNAAGVVSVTSSVLILAMGMAGFGIMPLASAA